MDKMHKGGCLCGKSRFEAYNEPDANIVCHCRYCQLRTGSPFGNILYFKKQDYNDLYNQLQLVCEDKSIVDRIILKGIKRANLFNQKNFIKGFEKLY